MASGPLRILHLNSARAWIGEAARTVEEVEEELALGADAFLLARAGHSVAAEAARRGLPHATARFESRLRPFADFADLRLIRRLVRERRIDLVHAHRGREHWRAVLALAGLRPRIPLVRTRHVLTPIRPHALNRWLYGRGTDGVICVSRAVETSFRLSFPQHRRPLAVIPGGARLDALRRPDPAEVESLRRELALPAGAPVLVLPARIDRIKGHLHAVAAFAKVRAHHPDAHLVFSHPRQSRHRALVEAEITRLGLEGSIRWLGERPDIAPLLALATVGLIASIGSEGWSRVAVEFRAAGVPVVGTAVGSVPEILEPGGAGLIVPPADPEAFAAAILRLLGEPDLRARAGAAGAEAFSVRRMAEETLAFCRRLLAREAP